MCVLEAENTSDGLNHRGIAQLALLLTLFCPPAAPTSRLECAWLQHCSSICCMTALIQHDSSFTPYRNDRCVTCSMLLFLRDHSHIFHSSILVPGSLPSTTTTVFSKKQRHLLVHKTDPQLYPITEEKKSSCSQTGR